MQLVLLTLLLHAAPSTPSPYIETRFELARSHEELSNRYKRTHPNNPDEPNWVENEAFVPLSTQVRKGKIEGPLSDQDQSLLQELDTLVTKAPPTKGSWYARPAAHPVGTPRPDNLPLPRWMDPLLRLGDTQLTPASGKNEARAKLKRLKSSRQQYSNLLLLEGSATDVKKVYFTVTSVTSARTMSSETVHALAVFEGGMLQRMVTLESRSSFPTEDTPAMGVTVVSPTYTQGKVSRMEIIHLDDNSAHRGLDTDGGINLEKVTLTSLTSS